MKIIIYTKTNCPWAIDALVFLNEKGISYEERNIVKNPEFRAEVENATGQNKSPTLLIGDVWLCDAGVEDIAKALEIKI